MGSQGSGVQGGGRMPTQSPPQWRQRNAAGRLVPSIWSTRGLAVFGLHWSTGARMASSSRMGFLEPWDRGGAKARKSSEPFASWSNTSGRMGGPSPEAREAPSKASRTRSRWFDFRHQGHRQVTRGCFRFLGSWCQIVKASRNHSAASSATNSPGSQCSENDTARIFSSRWHLGHRPAQGNLPASGFHDLGERVTLMASSSIQGCRVILALTSSTAWVTRTSRLRTGSPLFRRSTSGRRPADVSRSIAISSKSRSPRSNQALSVQGRPKPPGPSPAVPRQDASTLGSLILRCLRCLENSPAIQALTPRWRAVSGEQKPELLWAKCAARTSPFRKARGESHPGQV